MFLYQMPINAIPGVLQVVFFNVFISTSETCPLSGNSADHFRSRYMDLQEFSPGNNSLGTPGQRTIQPPRRGFKYAEGWGAFKTWAW